MPCGSTAFVAEAPPLSCASTAFVAKTPPSPCASTLAARFPDSETQSCIALHFTALHSRVSGLSARVRLVPMTEGEQFGMEKVQAEHSHVSTLQRCPLLLPAAHLCPSAFPAPSPPGIPPPAALPPAPAALCHVPTPPSPASALLSAMRTTSAPADGVCVAAAVL